MKTRHTNITHSTPVISLSTTTRRDRLRPARPLTLYTSRLTARAWKAAALRSVFRSAHGG
jgi:hypothetical protein